MTETIDKAEFLRLARAAGFYHYDMPDVEGQDLGQSLEADGRGAVDRLVASLQAHITDRLAAAEARNATLTDDAARLEFLASVAKEEFLRPSHDAEFFDHRMYWKLPTLMFINASGHEWTFRQAIDAQRDRAAASISTKGNGP